MSSDASLKDPADNEEEEEQEGEEIITHPWGYLVTIVSDCTLLFFFFFLFLFVYLYYARCLDLEKTSIENGSRKSITQVLFGNFT